MSSTATVWSVQLEHGTDAAFPLDEDEVGRANRFAFEVDRHRYCAAHRALRRVLCEKACVGNETLRFSARTGSKPELLGPAGWHFSLSYRADMALIGISSSHPIGVDIEVVDALRDTDALAADIFDEREMRVFRVRPMHARPLAFAVAWTRKEAVLKALGVGLSIDPSRVATGIEAEPRLVDVPMVDGDVSVRVESWVPAAGYAASVAMVVDGK